MKQGRNNMMYSCRKATELLDKKCGEKLTPLEQVKLFLHTRMCDACRAYEKQTTLIHKALNRSVSQDSISSTDLTFFQEKVKEILKD